MPTAILAGVLSLSAGCSGVPSFPRPERPVREFVEHSYVFSGPGSATVTAIVIEDPQAWGRNATREEYYRSRLEAAPFWEGAIPSLRIEEPRCRRECREVPR